MIPPSLPRGIHDYAPPCVCTAPVALVKKIKASGAALVQRQCTRCGEWSSEVPHRFLALNPDRLPDRDATRRDATRASRYEALRAVFERERVERDERWRAAYVAYLASPAWAARRAAVLRRAGGVCEVCRNAPATQAHHLTYDHIGNERPDELVAICRSCHEAATLAQRQMNSWSDA